MHGEINEMKKPKIALVVDVEGWALHNIARYISLHLAHQYEFEIFAIDVVGSVPRAALLTQGFDLVHFFWRIHWVQLQSKESQAEFQSLGVDFDAFMRGYRRTTALTSAVFDHLFVAPESAHLELAESMKALTAYSVSSQRLWRLYSGSMDYPAPTMVLEDGVDLALFKPSQLDRFEGNHGRSLVVGWAGNSGWSAETEDYKGVHTILRPAVERLRAQGWAIELALADRQSLFVPHHAMPGFYSGIDVYVCTSKIEGTPNPVLEAMACGVPLISTDVGIVPEALGTLQSEFILRERNIEALERALLRLLKDKTLLKRLSDENLRSVLAWDWTIKARAYANFFDAGLARHRDARSRMLGTLDHGRGRTCFMELVVENNVAPVIESSITADWLRRNLVVCMLFYNKLEQTIESAESFLASGVRVNLMDNGSEESAARRMRAHFASNPQVEIVDAGCNAGVSGGRNRQLATTQAPWLFFVDNDITVQTPDWLERLAAAMRRTPGVDMYVPRLFNKHEDAWGWMSDFVVDEQGNCAFVATDSVFANSFPGGASVIDRRVFDRHGRYDEDLFVGFEDFELAIRAWRNGRPLLARHVEDIVLVHDHRVSQEVADKQTARVRYDRGHINNSHAVVQRKHGVLLDPNFGAWLKEQVRQLTGDVDSEVAAGLAAAELVPHALNGPTVRPRYCGESVHVLLLVNGAGADAWLSLRSASVAARHARMAGALVSMRLVGAPLELLQQAQALELLTAEEVVRSSSWADTDVADVAADVVCCLVAGLMSVDFPLQVAQEVRFAGNSQQKIYAPERVIWASANRSGVQLQRICAFDALLPQAPQSPYPLFAISGSAAAQLGAMRTSDLAGSASRWLPRLIAQGCQGWGVPDSLAIVAVDDAVVCEQTAFVRQLHGGAELQREPATWLFLAQESLRHIALHHRTASFDWATLPKGLQRQDGLVSRAVYPVLSRLLECRISHVLIVPWLKRGGADKASLAYLLALAEKRHGRVLLITTERSASHWMSRVPHGVEVLNWPEVMGAESNVLARQSLAWMLLRLRPTVVHVMNSWLGWEMLAVDGFRLRAVMETFASLFWYGPSDGGELRGYASEYACRVERSGGVSLFITDNDAFPKQLGRDYGMAPDRFRCVWHPTTFIANAVPVAPAGVPTILWASRFAPEKRLDLLLEVARRCPDLRFFVFGDLDEADPSTGAFLVALEAFEHVVMGGCFDDFSALPLDECTGFLYTSSSDGMPNVVIEAMAHGLPVIASIVGGIEGLVSEETGWPVHAINDVDAYCYAVRQMVACPDERRSRSAAGLERVREHHSFGGFVGRLQAIPGYGLD